MIWKKKKRKINKIRLCPRVSPKGRHFLTSNFVTSFPFFHFLHFFSLSYYPLSLAITLEKPSCFLFFLLSLFSVFLSLSLSPSLSFISSFLNQSLKEKNFVFFFKDGGGGGGGDALRHIKFSFFLYIYFIIIIIIIIIVVVVVVVILFFVFIF